MSSSLNQMLADYGRCPLLTAAQEIHLGALVRRWQDFEDGPANAPQRIQTSGLRARDKLIKANTRLVVSLAKKLCRTAFSDDRLQEYIQNGMLGLARAAEKYDPSLGYKFSTYAHWWIRQSIGRGAEFESIIRIPGNALQEYRTLERAIAKLQQEGRKPTPELLSELTGFTTTRIAYRLEIGKVKLVKSLDAQASGDVDGSALIDLLADDSQYQEYESMDQETLKEWLEQNMDCLTDRQTLAIELTLQGLTRKEIAGTMGCSRSGVGLHIAAAKTRLREQYATAA
jgi:RNA polymerase sigma factor (sigma-70 family)